MNIKRRQINAVLLAARESRALLLPEKQIDARVTSSGWVFRSGRRLHERSGPADSTAKPNVAADGPDLEKFFAMDQFVFRT